MPAQGGRYPVDAHDRPLRWRLYIGDDSARQGFFAAENCMAALPRRPSDSRGFDEGQGEAVIALEPHRLERRGIEPRVVAEEVERGAGAARRYGRPTDASATRPSRTTLSRMTTRPGPAELERPVEIAGIVGFVGVDEDQVEWRPSTRRQQVQRGPDADLDPLRAALPARRSRGRLGRACRHIRG